MLRIALKESDYKDLLDRLENDEWDHPVFWRLRTKWSEHMRGKSVAAQEAAKKPATKRATKKAAASA
jgi:hypothetical protein